MMDEAIKTHKETTFGWLLMVQAWIDAGKTGLARRAREQAAQVITDAAAKSRRALTPR
jgi:hypothetical protein